MGHGGKRPGAGRPPIGDFVLTVRLSNEQRDWLLGYAKDKKVSISFAVRHLLHMQMLSEAVRGGTRI